MEKFYGIHKEELWDLAKVAVYTGISAMLAVTITGLQDIHVSGTAAMLFPIVNVVLVALKDFLDGK
jgi:hypothetical protein